MSGAYLTIDFLGGTHINDAANEASQLADRVKINVNFKFNEVDCNIAPGADPQELVSEWHKALASKQSHKMVFARWRPAAEYAHSAGEKP